MQYLVVSHRLDDDVRAVLKTLKAEHGSVNKALRIKLLGEKPSKSRNSAANGRKGKK